MSPKEYVACRESEIKSGKTRKVAQRICAIHYWKVHGQTVMQAHRRLRK
jgi:hypothetical protein